MVLLSFYCTYQNFFKKTRELAYRTAKFSFSTETVNFTHETVNCSKELAIKIMVSHWELKILGIQKFQNLLKSLAQKRQRLLFTSAQNQWNTYASILKGSNELRKAFF